LGLISCETKIEKRKRKCFPHRFASKRKLLNRSEAKNLNLKKSEKKQKNRLEFCFALFRLEAKITKVKRSEKFDAEISERSEKIEVKFYSEHAKHM
jgi:hypothetical protein